jgi:flagellar biosynthesis protein FlhA
VKDNIADLLSYTETQKLLNEVHKESEKLVADIVPSKIAVSGVQRILQNLLAEGISIRDIPTILEGIAEATAFTQNLTHMTEHVRGRLARQISAQQSREGLIPIVTLSPRWDQEFAESIVGQGDDRHLAMAPSSLQAFIGSVRETYDRLAADGDIPCILTNPTIRPFVGRSWSGCALRRSCFRRTRSTSGRGSKRWARSRESHRPPAIAL